MHTQFKRLMVLIAVATVDMIGGAMVFPLIPFYALKLHASPATIGMIIASFSTYWGQQWPGILAALLCFTNALFAWKWLPESKQPYVQLSARKPVWHGLWSVLRNPTGPVERLTLIYAVAMLAFSCLSSVL